MKIKAGELLNAVESLRKLGQDKMPLRAASWIVLLSKRLEPSYLLVIERRNEIIRKYCEEGKNSVATEKITDYLKEVEPMLLEEVEIDAIKVSSSIFESVLISPQDLRTLDSFFEQ